MQIVNNLNVAYHRQPAQPESDTAMPQTLLPSEVTGVVWKLEVKPGDSVVEGQTLVILESMKMEIPVSAPHAGTVLEVMVSEGEAVAEGQDMVLIA